MYKYAVLQSLTKLAEEKSKSNKKDNKSSNKSNNTKDNIAITKDPNLYDFNSVGFYENTPIVLSNTSNEAAYALRQAIQRGSGKDLSKLKHYKVNDTMSATDMKNMIKYNPLNTATAMHEYGHVVDQPSMFTLNMLNLIHPALGSWNQIRQENDANRKGLEAFRKGTAHNKALGDELDRVYSMTRDKALDSYRIARNYRTVGSLAGSAIGGLGGYFSAPDDTVFKTINTLGGAWMGGHIGGNIAGALAQPKINAKLDETINTLKSKEYTDAINNFNKNLIADARANNYYQPVVETVG